MPLLPVQKQAFENSLQNKGICNVHIRSFIFLLDVIESLPLPGETLSYSIDAYNMADSKLHHGTENMTPK